MEYQLVKDYKGNETLRKSFSRLAKETFGIDFVKWYDAGGWNSNYIPYSFSHDNRIVANVSVNTMQLMILGEVHKAIQIGTVMTEKSHRGQGLASRLIERVLKDYDGEYSFYFLAADEKAVPLYKRYGFSPIKTERFILDTSCYNKREKPLVHDIISIEDLLEYKRTTFPLSTKFSAIGDEHILVFYYVHGFDQFIYKLSDNTVVLFEMEGNELHLYDVFSKKKPDLKEIIEKILPENAEKIVFHFIPDGDLEGLRTEEDPEAGWMIRDLENNKFPKGLSFPEISKA